MRQGKASNVVAGRQWMTRIAIGFFAPVSLWVFPAAAQGLPIAPSSPDQATTQNDGVRDIGRTADTGIGVVGQRQTAAAAVPSVEPMGRINSRIPNRVQNRLRNRIDRNYDPTINATSPFEAADERVRETGRARSR